jgi:hypothetical protein
MVIAVQNDLQLRSLADSGGFGIVDVNIERGYSFKFRTTAERKTEQVAQLVGIRSQSLCIVDISAESCLPHLSPDMSTVPCHASARLHAVLSKRRSGKVIVFYSKDHLP